MDAHIEGTVLLVYFIGAVLTLVSVGLSTPIVKTDSWTIFFTVTLFWPLALIAVIIRITLKIPEMFRVIIKD